MFRPVFIRAIKIFVSLYLTIALPVAANPLIYTAPSETQNGSFDGEIPIKQLGSLSLPKAVVQFKGNDINVLAVPDWLFDRNVVLSGSLVKAQIDLKGQSTIIHGLVYFTGGLWLTNLGSSSAIDIIDTISGDQLRGHIRACLDKSTFAFKPEDGSIRKLSFVEIKNIHSPRAYVFSIPTQTEKLSPPGNALQFDSSVITFAPSFAHTSISKTVTVPKSTLAGTEPGISRSEIGALIGVNVANELAPAIALPLVLNRGTESQALREIKFFDSTQQRAAGIPVPIQY